jgi:hypothetical protein
VVLDHVAQRARLLVVAGARADAFFFGHGHLHVVDVLLVEERLEDAVREPHDEDVLDRFLPEVVVDAVDLPFGEHLRDRIVDRQRARQVAPDRLFHDEARKGRRIRWADELGAREVLHRGHEHRRRHGHVIDTVARQSALVFDHVEPRAERRERLRVVERRGHEVQRLGEHFPHRFVWRTP